MTAGLLNFPGAVPATKTEAASANRIRVLRGTQMALRAAVGELCLLSESPPLPSSTVPVAVALTAVTVSSRCNPRILRRPQVPGPACRPPSPFPFQVHRLGDRFQAGERVAAQDAQAVVKVVEHQARRDRPAEVLPGCPVHAEPLVVRRAAADLTVPGAANRAAPDPVAADVSELIENPVDNRPSRVDPWHANSLHQALVMSSRRRN